MTVILIKGIPPEMYGINLEKWKQEQKTIVWRERNIPNHKLEKAKKRGAIVLKKEEDYSVIREPSRKEDTAGNIFKNIRIKFEVDREILKAFLKSTQIPEKEIGRFHAYYSKRRTGNISGTFIQKKKIVCLNEKKEIGSQEIILRILLKKEFEGILIVSYIRKEENNYELEGSVLARQYEKTLDKTMISKRIGLPSTFEIPEKQIMYKIFEE